MDSLSSSEQSIRVMALMIGRNARVDTLPTVSAQVRACGMWLAIGLVLPPTGIVLAQVASFAPDALPERTERSSRPGEANPSLSLLTPADHPEWALWEQEIRTRSRRQAARLQVSLIMVPVHDELEPPGQSGWNDDLNTAEHVGEFGSSAGHESELDIQGFLSPPEPLTIGPVREDDGSILLANPTSLTPGTRQRAYATIGDGPHGSSGSGSGDYDFYRLGDLRQGQRLTVVVTPDESDLDAKVALYDVTGARVFDDDTGFLEATVPIDGTYYVCVRGHHSDWPEDPFDSASGPKTGSEGSYSVVFGLDADDIDIFSVGLRAGDVLGFRLRGSARLVELIDDATGTLLVGSNMDASVLYPNPEISPLPRGGNASGSHVVSAGGTYALSVSSGEGPYELTLLARRPATETRKLTQVLFVDFDGAEINADSLFGEGNDPARLTPMSSFLDRFGLDPTPLGPDEREVIATVMRVVEEKLHRDMKLLNPDFDLEIRSSADHEDLFGDPGVSRMIVGGTQDELGIETIGRSESVDVGNFHLEETGVVLMDRLSSPDDIYGLQQFGLDDGASMSELVGLGVATIIAHEAGHLFGNFHTGTPESAPNIMDTTERPASEFFGIGDDNVFGTGDDEDVTFGPAPYYPTEGLSGIQDTRAAIAFGLTLETSTEVEEPGRVDGVSGFDLSAVYPNPARTSGRVMLDAASHRQVTVSMYDAVGRLVGVVFDGFVAAGQTRVVDLHPRSLPAGTYILRASDGRTAQSALFVVVG